MKGVVRGLVYLAIAGLAAAALYGALSRPGLQRWRVTDDEWRRALPGDELVPDPDWVTTRGITIEAPVESVWPWLAQIGYHRAGWYSYDALHRLLGVAGSVDDPQGSAQRIVPELQGLASGDVIRIFAAGPLTARLVEPPNVLLLTSGEGEFRLDPAAGGMSWLWLVEPAGPGRSRLIVRTRSDYGSSLLYRVANWLVIEPGGFLMERKTMLNLKRLAEGGR